MKGIIIGGGQGGSCFPGGIRAQRPPNDMREGTGRVVLEGLWARGATVTAFDPMATQGTRHICRDRADLAYAENSKDALKGADALAIAAEWKAFKSPDFNVIKGRLKQPVIFGGRKLFEPASVAAQGIEYHGIGRKGKVK